MSELDRKKLSALDDELLSIVRKRGSPGGGVQEHIGSAVAEQVRELGRSGTAREILAYLTSHSLAHTVGMHFAMMSPPERARMADVLRACFPEAFR